MPRKLGRRAGAAAPVPPDVTAGFRPNASSSVSATGVDPRSCWVDRARFGAAKAIATLAMPAFSPADILTPGGLAALGQVVLIDLMLAGDNVVVLGTLAAGLPVAARRRVLAIGIGVALVCLVGFAWFATALLAVVGLLFAGGLLLLWVAWRLWRDLRSGTPGQAGEVADTPEPPQSIARAAARIALADLSMSLDNVLAVAGAAREHPTVLLVGLALSITLMAVAANLIARVIGRHRWMGYVGLAAIIWIAGSMVREGWTDPQVGLSRFAREWVR
jgi:YjbE family integral membrane protein